MPIETIDGTSLQYHLIAFDKQGRERGDDPDGQMSRRAIETLRSAPVTDVFITSHGWKGDVTAAREQYQKWIGAMAACAEDRQRMEAVRPGFTPLIIGFHWPSLPFGEEELGHGLATFGAEATPAAEPFDLDALVEAYVDRLADTPGIRAALRTILAAAGSGANTPALTPELREAYVVIDRELNLPAEGAAGDPGGDREPFDPERAFASRSFSAKPTFGGGGFGGALLGPLRQLSFWKMKDRARAVGESGGADLLDALQAAVPAGRDVRFHLMGHSFGCIVMSSIVRGRDPGSRARRPVQSLALVQGALSLWSYTIDIPSVPGRPGYFHPIIAGRRVSGAMVTTQSRYDTAVGKLYPAAAGAARQVTFAPGDLPKYGALGAFGVRGAGLMISDLAMKPAGESYGFQPGGIYNLESSAYICEGGGLSGAHSDIARAEVAHAVWEAAMVS